MSLSIPSLRDEAITRLAVAADLGPEGLVMVEGGGYYVRR
jgi:hypothetical protein